MSSPMKSASWSGPEVVGLERRLPECRALGHDRRHRVVAGELTADDLDELHDRNRVHEVHADDLTRTLRRGADHGDRDGRRIRRQNGLGLADRIEPAEELGLDGGVLDDCLDDEVAIGQRIDVGGSRDAAHHVGGSGVGVEFLLRGEPTDRLLDLRQRLLERRGHHVDEHDLAPLRGKYLCDPVAHRPGADHADLLDLHRLVSVCQISRMGEWWMRWPGADAGPNWVIRSALAALDRHGDGVAATEAQTRNAGLAASVLER